MRYLSLSLLLVSCTPAKDSNDTSADTSVTDTSVDTADTSTDSDTSDDTSKDSDTSDTSDTSVDTGDTSVDTGDTSTDTGDTSIIDTGDTSIIDTGDTSIIDTGDTSTDTGDTSGDTGDTSGDTGDTSTDTGASACTAKDLLWGSEVRDSAGVAGVSFAKGTKLTMAAVIQNPCSNDVTFTTPDTCLVTTWETIDASGMGQGVAVACAGVLTSWTVPAGGTLEETMPWGKMAVNSYQLKVGYNYGGYSSTTNFSVF